MLIIMKNGDGAAFLELPLDAEAAGRGDILQIDPAKVPLEQLHGADDLLRILGTDAEG